jgi:hypothetical protein
VRTCKAHKKRVQQLVLNVGGRKCGIEMRTSVASQLLRWQLCWAVGLAAAGCAEQAPVV